MGEYDRGNSDINCSMALALGLGDDEVYLACLKQQIFCGIQTGNTGSPSFGTLLAVKPHLSRS